MMKQKNRIQIQSFFISFNPENFALQYDRDSIESSSRNVELRQIFISVSLNYILGIRRNTSKVPILFSENASRYPDFLSV